MRLIGIVIVNRSGHIIKIKRYTTPKKAYYARGAFTKDEHDRSGVYNLDTREVLVPVFGKVKGIDIVMSKVPMSDVIKFMKGSKLVR